MSRLCPNSPNARILDCFLSNYGIGQSLDGMARFTGLGPDEVKRGVDLLVREGMVRRSGGNYITNSGSRRLVGLYGYYRATLESNLASVFS